MEMEPRWLLALATGALVAPLALGFARRGHGRRAAVLALLAVVVAALALRPPGAPSASEALLATAGASGPLPAAAWRIDAPALAGGRALADAGALARRLAPGARLRVAGHGLPSWEWSRSGLVVAPEAPPPARPGVRRAAWRRHLVAGEPLVVRASIGGVDGGARLVGPEGAGPERPVAAAGTAVDLAARPPLAGRHLYRLEVRDADGAVAAAETIDVVVGPPRPLAVLWLEDAPSFETRHVKEWLSAAGHRLAVRSRVSRGRYRYELHGLDGIELARLGPELLARFDLVVAEPVAVAGLAAGQGAWLEDAVEAGAGLLLRPGRGLGAGPRPAAIGIAGPADGEPWRLRLEWPGHRTAALDLTPRELELGAGAWPLVEDRQGRVLAAAEARGRGRLGIALPRATYRWVLEGAAEDHAAYWSRLIDALARPATGGGWLVRSGPILADEPLSVRLAPAGPGPEAWLEWLGHRERLSLAPAGPGAELAVASVRPAAPGWHRLLAGGAEAWFYVQPRDAWPAWQEARRQSDTRRAAELGPRPAVAPAVADRRRAVRPALFALLVALCGGLWATERWGRGGSPRPAERTG